MQPRRRLNPKHALILVLTMAAAAFVSSQSDEIQKKAMPDIIQRDPEGQYAGDGLNFCGPCAAANALLWLGAHGYEGLLPPGRRPEIRERMLVSLLASSRYMQTAEKNQTSPAALNEGIRKYIEDCGYEIQKFETYGFKPFEATNVVLPDVAESLKEGLQLRSVAVLHVGWYKHNKDNDEYTRFTGHYVTVVGFGHERNGAPNDRVVVIHDPWNGPGDDYVKLEPLLTGTLITEKAGQQIKNPLKGSFKLTGEMCIYEKADIGLLDHIHILTLAKPKNPVPRP